MQTSLRERRRQLLHAEILEAARILLVEKGYATMSMDELAARVGVSKPTLYSHFATKEDIVVAAATALMQRILAVIAAGPGERSPLEQLTHLLQTTIQIQVDEGALAVQIWMPEVFQLLRSHPDSFACLQQIDDAVVSLVQAAIAEGEIDSQFDPAAVVRAFNALACAPYFASLSKSGTPNPVTLATMLATLFKNGLGSGSDQPRHE